MDEDAISPLWKGQRFPKNICIGGYCMGARQPIVIPDVYEDERIPIAAYRPTFIQSLVMVPIRTEDPIGAIGNYWATPHTATPEEIRLLQALANTTSVALENVQVYTELEQRVQDRTRELQSVNQELEAFAYTLSHDLRTPLTALKGFNSLLQFQYAKQLSGKGENYVSGIGTAVDRITCLIEGMLVLHRAKQGDIQWQVVDLSQMAQEVIGNLQTQFPDRVVEVAIAAPLKAQGDPTLLRVVLENLLSNAWKYSLKTSQPRIEFAYSQETAAFCIKDNGAGFDMQQVEKLFQPFQRLHDHRDFPGTGVGLASVARIIKRHSGQIWATGMPSQGATFFFTLPMAD